MSYPVYIAIFGAVVWFIACARLRVLNQWHHFHVGAWVFILGHEFGIDWLAYSGLVVLWDDSWQHAIQNWHPDYASPINRLYAWMAPYLPKALKL